MKIAICDNQKQDRTILTQYLNVYGQSVCADLTIQEFQTGKTFMYAFNKNPNDYSLIFLDIYLDDMNGLEMCRLIRQANQDVIVIFVTTSPHHALESYELEADGYILKPYSYEKFQRIMRKSLYRLGDNFQKLTIISKRIPVSCYLKDIYYIESFNHVCMIHLKSDTIETNISLKELAEKIHSNCFLRVSRSYIVNMNLIQSIDVDNLILTNGERIILPIRGRQRIRQLYSDYQLKTNHNS